MEIELMLCGRSIAILMTDGAEEHTYMHLRHYLEGRGASVRVVAPKCVGDHIQMYRRTLASSRVTVAEDLKHARVDNFDALVIPSGLLSQVGLRLAPEAAGFIAAFDAAGKPIVAINHATVLLVRWGQLHGAGPMDCPCLVTGNLITSGPMPDMPALERELADQLILAREPASLH